MGKFDLSEFQKSAIAPAVVEANFRYIEGAEFVDFTSEGLVETSSDATGTYLTSRYSNVRRKYWKIADQGGWVCQGLDIASLIPEGEDVSLLNDGQWAELTKNVEQLYRDDWGCLKPYSPLLESEFKKDKGGNWVKRGKRDLNKYINPTGVSASIFALDVPGNPRYWLDVLSDVSQDIYITEGAKKAAALISQGKAAIAIAGITMWSIPKTEKGQPAVLKPELAAFARKGRTFRIVLDQDTKAKTVRDVNSARFALSVALKKAGAAVKIVEWSPMLGKGVDDLIVNHGAAAFDLADSKAKNFAYWALTRSTALTYPVAYSVPAGQRYIDGKHGTDEAKIPFPADAKLIALVAPKGTGKTDAIGRRIGVALQNGQRVLLITHRVQLTQTLCDRTGIPSIYDIRFRNADASQGHGLCIQSLHGTSQAGFDPAAWADALVVVDEAEQVAWEMLNSSTCKGHRVDILESIQQVVRQAMSADTDGQLMIADADLSDTGVKFFTGMVEGTAPAPWIVRSQYQGDDATYQVTIYTDNAQQLQNAEERLDAGERLLIVTDSQKSKSKYGSLALADRWAKKYPHLKGLRLDSETLGREDSEAFGAFSILNSIINQYDYVICSPSVETGVSLDVRGHFTRVIGFYQGVMAENSVRQSLARLRDNVPRDICLPKRGLSFVGGSELSAAELLRSQKDQVVVAIARITDGARAVDYEFIPTALLTWATLATRQNAAMTAYAECIVDALAAEGHGITYQDKAVGFEKELIKELKEAVTDDRHTRVKEEADLVSEAQELTDRQLAEAERSNTVKNRPIQLAVKKAKLQRLYGGHDVTPDLFILDEYSWYKGVQLHYYLTEGRAYLKASDAGKLKDLMKEGDYVWAPDVIKSTLGTKVALLELLKVTDLLKEETITQTSKSVKRLARAAWGVRGWVKKILGFSISEAEMSKPVLIAKKFLGAVGFGTGTAVQSRGGGAVARYYPVIQIDHKTLGGVIDGEFDPKAYQYDCDRSVVFEGWLAKDSGSQKKQGEILETIEAESIQPAQGVTSSVIDLIYSPETVTGDSVTDIPNKTDCEAPGTPQAQPEPTQEHSAPSEPIQTTATPPEPTQNLAKHSEYDPDYYDAAAW